MNRRESIAGLLALGACMLPTALRAQYGTKTLGMLWLAPIQAVNFVRAPLLERLKALGWVEQQNLAVVAVSAENRAERLPGLAADLARRGVDLIWVGTPETAIAAARATRDVPIVFANIAWPVETGLIESFARPGRNVTGMAGYAGLEVSAKRLEFLREIAPDARRLSWIQAPTIQATVAGGQFDILPELESAAKRLGYDVRHHFVQQPADLDAAFGAITAWGAQALAVAWSAQTFAARARIAEFALRNRLPSAFLGAQWVEAGGLLSYNADFSENVVRSGEYVHRILRGARPQDLPVERPERYELVINLRTAKAIGVTVPQSILLRADRVIE